MRNKGVMISLLLTMMIMVFGGSAYAFQDINNVPGKDKILDLKKQGILSGVSADKFAPDGKVTNAQAIAMIVKGLDLNIDNIRFIKEPKASDNFTKIKDDAWYASAFIIAPLNGLEIPKDIDPNANITREQYVHYLFQGMTHKGDYAFIEMYVMLNDEAKVDIKYMNSIQKMVISKIAELDKNNNFRPKEAITRAEAAVLLYNTKEFIRKQQPVAPIEPQPEYDVTLTTTPVNDQINEITLLTELPNPGYGLVIESITFIDKEAVIQYKVTPPAPGVITTQQIVTAKVSTYVASSFKAVLQLSQSATDAAKPAVTTSEANSSSAVSN